MVWFGLTIDYIKADGHCVYNKPPENLKENLENVAINDVSPLKAARRDAIANLKCFWGPGKSAT